MDDRGPAGHRQRQPHPRLGTRASRAQGLGWPVRIALAFGAILLAAGILLFVSAHWDELSRAAACHCWWPPWLRCTARRGGRAPLRRAFRGVARGGQRGAGGGHRTGGTDLQLERTLAGGRVVVGHRLRAGMVDAWHWTQGALCAVLFPWWLAGEWGTRVPLDSRATLPIWVGFCALSFAYLSARRSAADGPLRKAVGWLGGLALLPAAAILAAFGGGHARKCCGDRETLDRVGCSAAGPAVGRAGTGCAAGRLERGAIAWAVVLGAIGIRLHESIALYCWCATGAAGLAVWGVRDGRVERVNLACRRPGNHGDGVLFFGVMDKLGRSASLIGIGLLFLGGGWLLEQTRRRLLAHSRGGFMKPVYRGIAVAVLQCLMVLSVAGKYALDRERLPRAWAKATVRSESVRARTLCESEPAGGELRRTRRSGISRLSVVGGRLWRRRTPPAQCRSCGAAAGSRRAGRVLYSGACSRSFAARSGRGTLGGGECAGKGEPRPTRLGVKKGGVITPMTLR